MYVSRVTFGYVGVWCGGGLMSKLSGFCGCVHGAFGRNYGVARCCSFLKA